MSISEALQWLEHFIVYAIRQSGQRQRALLALDAVKKFVSEAQSDRPNNSDQRQSPRRMA